ncbi:MAG: serine O-acetyltransferase [Gammaproteobacteria bacterium]
MFKRLREDIHSVFERDPAARSFWEVLTTYPGIHAIIWHRFNHRLWQAGLKWPARCFAAISRWLTGIEIHPAAKLGRRFFIDHGMGVVIGETAEVGDDCTLYHGVTLGGTSWRQEKRHPTLQNKVIVGAGAKILGPITIGENARIGSNSVVVKDVPPNTTVVGIPAREVVHPLPINNVSQQAMKEKLGFDAYAVAETLKDPVGHAITSMLNHMLELDTQLNELKQSVTKLGGAVDNTSPCHLQDDELDAFK